MGMNGRWSVFSADGRAIAMCLPSSKEQAGSAGQSRGYPGGVTRNRLLPGSQCLSLGGGGGSWVTIFQG